ncbi:hypothetical protein N7E81_03580 [Reichenbachiella carrageenanivorans]|uniref:Uncharacterized protein n=1 Tax=Reichenbachiella carrageenanivorans TaxID=2979869 RepID=A0ABY6D217_9BACT|nr:hypothetical protein [Reichenbachiella carrageenanivorans]UXX80181.1 hypothetical protein N7E81_03580 [Reichenbachiella carrageenanivorans]
MKKLILTLCIAAYLGSFTCLAQTDDAIEKVKTGLFKNQAAYKKCGITMSSAQFMTLMKDDPNMSEFVKPLALNSMGDALLTAASSVLIFWPIGEYIAGNDDPNWTLAYIGAGCALLSIPFKKGFEKNADKAMNYYNNGYKKVAVNFNFNINTNGLGLAMRFR